jgi:hypothetical protein
MNISLVPFSYFVRKDMFAVLQHGVWAGWQQLLTVKDQHITKCYTQPRDWVALVNRVMNLGFHKKLVFLTG